MAHETPGGASFAPPRVFAGSRHYRDSIADARGARFTIRATDRPASTGPVIERDAYSGSRGIAGESGAR
ncbi:hypothetical protein [Burkholderia thailandensis]|uniref:hypothetical protein n=1 Tax=Burkholderia thailandensis TaxID=57975 RepID=UPI0002D9CCAD|nr:hypothetical protein [Burkholderia thailandensis]MCS3397982.1 hypothetical protein [Burkholderia thailandensis]MCS6476710.1 hypothetical protein [Burkholderia thailandensis]MCS6495614.1 hypothetical protein [Burkholderia thailandensis]MCS6500101.1 hypothetical protein [Burkholderia thailandensis]MCS6511272.1 hypothetical protein [Burkholderia thailandensis]